MKIEAPVMTEEDQYGYNMPDQYKCDSCKAVMFHLEEGLRKKQPKSRRLKQWEYTDLLEDLCKNSFEGYGIKLINGQNTLSGPGLKDPEQLTPGMGAIQMGGESWTKRLAEECRKIVFERVGEEDMYDKFYASYKKEADSTEAIDFGAAFKDVCDSELRFCKAGPDAPKAKKEKKDKKAEKKAKEAEKKAKKEAEKAKKSTAQKTAEADKKEAPAKANEVDVQTFLRQLAVKHGLSSEEYVAARSEKDWEKLMISMASRIFNKQSDEL